MTTSRIVKWSLIALGVVAVILFVGYLFGAVKEALYALFGVGVTGGAASYIKSGKKELQGNTKAQDAHDTTIEETEKDARKEAEAIRLKQLRDLAASEAMDDVKLKKDIIKNSGGFVEWFLIFFLAVIGLLFSTSAALSNVCLTSAEAKKVNSKLITLKADLVRCDHQKKVMAKKHRAKIELVRQRLTNRITSLEEQLIAKPKRSTLRGALTAIGVVVVVAAVFVPVVFWAKSKSK